MNPGMAMMNEQSQYRRKRAHLGKIIAPRDVLGKQSRLGTFLRLAFLASKIPSQYQPDLLLLSGLQQRLARYIGKHSPKTSYEHQKIYIQLKTDRKMTDAPFAATLCVNGTMTEAETNKYEVWASLIVGCSLQLHIIGRHYAAIQSGLREIRLIATEDKHSQLLRILPDPHSFKSFAELSEALQLLRKGDYSDIETRGLGYLHVVISDAVNQSKGVLRNRVSHFTPNIEEEVYVRLLESLDDTGLEIHELDTQPVVDSKSSMQDESNKISAGKTLRIHDPRSQQKTNALNAIQGRRLAELLSVRQQSLPCSFEQATEWDIRHLIQSTLDKLRLHDTSASLLLLALVTGRDPTALLTKHKNDKVFVIAKEHPCLIVHHSVPATNQPTQCESYLPEVRDKLYLPLPKVFGPWVLSLDMAIKEDETESLKPLIKEINQLHGTRITLSRITRYLEHWLINHGVDRATVAILRGESHKSRPALSYSHKKVDDIIKDYYDCIFSCIAIT
jgi:hypothetical protein